MNLIHPPMQKPHIHPIFNWVVPVYDSYRYWVHSEVFTFHFLFPAHQYDCFGGKFVTGSVMLFFTLVFSLRLWHCPKRSVPLFICFSSLLNSAWQKYHVFMRIACGFFVKKIFNSAAILTLLFICGQYKGKFFKRFCFYCRISRG